jgi:hypothetical protein
MFNPFKRPTKMQINNSNAPLLQPNAIYDLGDKYGLVEYIGTSGKKPNEESGFRFWSLKTKSMVTLTDSQFLSHRQTATLQ